MPGIFKTEAVVLRSIRFGEADRVLHLYSSTRGRVGAIAKGARRPRSRFGGRLEPFFRLDLMLHEGRGELATVTSAATLDGYPRLRESGPALDAGGRACDAVLRLFDAAEANSAVYNLLCRYLALLDGRESVDGNGSGDGAAGLATALAFRLKLTLAAGFVPELASCARCGEADGLAAFSGAAGGMVCGACEAGGFELSAEAHRFMVEALGSPLGTLPPAGDRALRQVERAISETLEHHAHVRLRAAGVTPQCPRAPRAPQH
jgi:DNA repair protein RecO (recombination protein O)